MKSPLKKVIVPKESVVHFNITNVYFEKNGCLYRGRRPRKHSRHETCVESTRDFKLVDIVKIKFTEDQCKSLGIDREKALKRWKI